MARGAQVAERARRRSDLDRLNTCGKEIIRLVPLPPFYTVSGYLAKFEVDGVEVCQELTRDPEYPSDRVMATIN
jgi:hypothetical protein